MIEKFEHVTAETKANVYFDGKVISHTLWLADECEIPAGFEPSERRTCWTTAGEEQFFRIGKAFHYMDWERTHRFCGRCGAVMVHGQTERSQICPVCGQVVYPKICPAIIAAVYDGDRLLLTRYRGRPFVRYALVAGFNEIGESIEDTVRREVFEEVGLRVRDLQFYKSQPWVFTDSLLMGFFARLDGSDAITLQEDELSEAQWFPRAEIPDDHSAISLTGEMIEFFRAHGAPPASNVNIL